MGCSTVVITDPVTGEVIMWDQVDCRNPLCRQSGTSS